MARAGRLSPALYLESSPLFWGCSYLRFYGTPGGVHASSVETGVETSYENSEYLRPKLCFSLEKGCDFLVLFISLYGDEMIAVSVDTSEIGSSLEPGPSSPDALPEWGRAP